ncbi:hypothetical protein Tco_0667257, partial [Tanacetum coccineum]
MEVALPAEQKAKFAEQEAGDWLCNRLQDYTACICTISVIYNMSANICFMLDKCLVKDMLPVDASVYSVV